MPMDIQQKCGESRIKFFVNVVKMTTRNNNNDRKKIRKGKRNSSYTILSDLFFFFQFQTTKHNPE